MNSDYTSISNETPNLYFGLDLAADESECNTISFLIENEVMIKITKEGFFWKCKLVEEDKEIYQIIKNFLKKSNAL
ncbi:MAG: hypothetical protein PF487_03470 [Bacteroidales bacterium]|jgi:hypothetical protein|nr:hypothetical protein [Bacteroidales bacterium]